jgi:hypothetical protein
MLGVYGVFVQSQVGFQPVLSLLLLQLQASIKAFGHSSLYVLLLSMLIILCVLTLCAMALWRSRFVCSCFGHSSLFVLLLWVLLVMWLLALGDPCFVCFCFGHSSLYVLLLSTFLTLWTLALNIPHFMCSCSWLSSLLSELLVGVVASQVVTSGVATSKSEVTF